MKSIIEEASSVIKAIENGWVRAGKPYEFSIKVYEEAQKNFFGLTTKSAKIALFFTDKPASKESAEKTQKAKRQVPQQAPIKQHKAAAPAQQPKSPQPEESLPKIARQKNSLAAIEWTDEMVSTASSWLQQSLVLADLADKAFTTDISKHYLRFTFSSPLFDDRAKEKTIFRSFAYLIIATLRNKFKKDLRGFKVILMST